MVKINKVQALLYSKCKELDYTVYDEVPEKGPSFPCVVIGDIKVEELEMKDEGHSYNFQINVFSIYNGKFEANEMIERIETNMKDCNDTELEDNYYIDSVEISNCEVFKTETCYQGIANLLIDVINI
ncbi:tail completion protein gp17 [Paraclostridium dentum]|uniref:tail completion protein gp17 n=1 Tax=Paraclostridium dentum TaxID=2662455 RepID=UPI00051CFFFC|nr:DUF3168 domain-containing protein [Paraclostridium dentum]KGJ49704.1 hypothetical protein KD33_07015 [Clostridium sp. NCR]